jgi:hypothetical protein
MKREHSDSGPDTEESPAKRVKRDPAAPTAVAAEEPAPAAVPAAQEEPDDEDVELGKLLPRSTTRSAVKKGQECPYLDTIHRSVRHSSRC